MARRQHLGSAALLGRAEEGFQQGVPAINRKPEDALEQIGTALGLLVFQSGLIFLSGDNGNSVFQKIDTAFFALAAMGLPMVTRRTFEAERGMAPRTVQQRLARFRATLRALHAQILAGIESHAACRRKG